jgi:hypothetical protein
LNGNLSERVALAYAALLNSVTFISICSAYTRHMKGGQLDFYPNHIKEVPVPDLSQSPDSLIEKLSEMGDGIIGGIFPDLDRLDDTVAQCYGLNRDDLAVTAEAGSLGEEFSRLARQWKRDTSRLSSPKHIVAHPAYQRIVRMGREVIPLILEEMHSKPARWLYALRDITGADPVKPEHRGDVQKMASDWLSWIHS